jgi:Sec-independent protein translocase protein TatA
MSVHALKQVIHDIKESADSAGRHLHVGMPTLFKKQGKRLHKLRDEFKQMDKDGARRANQEAKAALRDKPYDLRKTKKGLKGAGDKDFRDHAADEILDNAGKALKEFKGKDFGEGVKDAARELVKGINSHDTRLKLMRTYMLALKGELVGKGEDMLKNSAATALYDVYLEGTPAEDAVDRKTFNEYVGKGIDLGKKGKDLPAPIEGHTF